MFGGFPIPLDSKKKYRVRTQSFLANTTWIKPPKIWGDVCWVTGIGGGGNGGSASSTSGSVFFAGGGGGTGSYMENVCYDLKGIISVSIVIGGATQDSSFGSLVFKGGLNGVSGAVAYPLGSGGPGGYQNGGNASGSSYYTTVVINRVCSGPGGSSPYGPGGVGVTPGNAGNNAASNTGSGGSGGCSSDATARNGGTGGSGRIDIWWIEEC